LPVIVSLRAISTEGAIDSSAQSCCAAVQLLARGKMIRPHPSPLEKFPMALSPLRVWRGVCEDFCLETATAGVEARTNFATR
jgi:hypothetical protein